MVTLIQLEYIIAVDTYRHFVTAAEKCFVTQPTLSMQIKKMEEELGVVIFDRTKHPIIPTEIGEKIIEQARITLAESSRIKELVNEYSNVISGDITIGIIPSLATYLLPLFIGSFIEKYPDVTIKVVELLTEDIIDHLKKDLLDVGILVTPLNEKGIIEQPLFYEEMFLYANKNHPISNKVKINTDELASPDLWVLSDGHCFRSQVVNLCSYTKQVKANSHFKYESGSLETLKKMVEKEGGFTILPELAMDQTTKNTKTVVKQFSGKKPLREVSLVYTRNYAKRNLIALFSDEIKKAVPKELLSNKEGRIVEWRKSEYIK